MPEIGEAIDIGRGRIIKNEGVAAVLALGSNLNFGQQTSEDLELKGLSITIDDALFAKLIDAELIAQLTKDHGDC